MKKKSYLRLCFLSLFFMIVALLPACKKNADGGAPPVVKSVRLYLASPNDVEISNGDPKTSGALNSNGDIYVAIVGNNLTNATEIDFDGVPANFNTAFISSNNAVVKLPTIDYTKVDTTKLYSLVYKTSGGSTTFWFKLGPLMPTISSISNVFANPGDSVYLYGANLVLVQQFIYGGTKISSFSYNSDGSSLGFRMPAATPTTQIVVTTKSGTVVDTIKATPTITSVSNENASPGDSVYVHGTYLKNIQSLTYAGAPVSFFTTSADLKSVAFVAPASSSHSGPVSVTTKFGTGATIYKVNTKTYLQDGVIMNMANVGNGMGGWWAAGTGGANRPPDGVVYTQPSWFTVTTAFDGILGTNNTEFIFLNTGIGSPGDGQWYNGWGIDLADNQWVPTANLTDAPGNWALKLEISVGKDWNGGSLDISPGGGYIYRWEPWMNGTYKTKGWITLTIPLSSFRASDPTLGEGMGAPLTKLTDMLDAKGHATTYIYMHNYAAAKTITGFYGAFDNVRVVKIK